MKISPQAYAFWQKCLTKLTERSSVASYLSLFGALFAKQFQGELATAAGIVSATAAIVLFILSDDQVKAWLTGNKQ